MYKYGFEHLNYYPKLSLVLGWIYETLVDIIACNDNFTSSGLIAWLPSTYDPFLLTFDSCVYGIRYESLVWWHLFKGILICDDYLSQMCSYSHHPIWQSYYIHEFIWFQISCNDFRTHQFVWWIPAVIWWWSTHA